MNKIIEINHLTKEYQKNVKGIDDVSFSVGTISICGYDTKKQGDKVRHLIGYLPQELNMYQNLTVFDFVNYMALLKDIKDKKKVYEVLEQVDMAEFSEK